MLSSSAINSKALNAATSAAVVLATSAWVAFADAEITTTKIQYAEANIDCSVTSMSVSYTHLTLPTKRIV